MALTTRGDAADRLWSGDGRQRPDLLLQAITELVRGEVKIVVRLGGSLAHLICGKAERRSPKRYSMQTMGVFEISIKARKWLYPPSTESERGEDVFFDALVDTGAVQAALPADLVEKLRLVEMGQVRAYTADGVVHQNRVVGIVELEVQGRLWQGGVIELPQGALPLLGAVPLEEMDWHVSPAERKLLPNPRSPEGPLLPLV